MCDVWPFSVRVCVPVTASQRRMVPLPSPLASVRPSGLDATLVTSVLCPSSVQRCAPVTASQIRMVSSPLPLASVRPSGLKATLVMSAACPSRIRCCTPVATFQRRMVLPKPPLASVVPSGLNARLDLAGLYAMRRTSGGSQCSVRSCAPALGFHSWMVVSPFQLASVLPSGLNAML